MAEQTISGKIIRTGSIPLSALAGGLEGGSTFTGISGEAIAAGAVVYAELFGGAGTAGNVYNADSSSPLKSTAAFVIGIAPIGSASSGLPVVVQWGGTVSGTFVAGKPYYIGTAGALTATVPGNAYLVGVALSSSLMALNNRGLQSVLTPTTSGIAGIKAFALGGFNGAGVTTASEVMTFATETFAGVSSADLSVGGYLVAGVSDGSTNGYSFGGISRTTTTDKTVIATNTTSSSPSTTIPGGAYGVATAADHVQYAYAAGGFAGADVVTGYVVVTATDVISTLSSANLSAARDSVGCAFGGTVGWMVGGELGGTPVGNADAINYSTQTTSAVPGANLTSAASGLAILSDGATQCVLAGGTAGGGANTTAADLLVWATQITSSLSSADLSLARRFPFNFSEGTTAGYMAGGDTTLGGGGMVTTADKCTYATNTTAAYATSDLTVTQGFGSSLAI